MQRDKLGTFCIVFGNELRKYDGSATAVVLRYLPASRKARYQKSKMSAFLQVTGHLCFVLISS